MLLALSSTGAIELTAYATLGLAVVTSALAAATFWMVKLTRRTLGQSQDEIALSRREVEEAHRPVLIPLADSRYLEVVAAGIVAPLAAGPFIHEDGQLTVPIENIGTGPAVQVLVSVEVLNEHGGPTQLPSMPAKIAGVKALGSVAPVIRVGGEIAKTPDFRLTLAYEDVAGKRWVTRARYTAYPVLSRYEDLTISTAASQSPVRSRRASRTR